MDAVRARFDEARQAGAVAVMVGPGPAPAVEADRLRALGHLTDSMAALCAAAPDLRVMIEPLDVHVHKKQTLGYTTEAVAMAQALADAPGRLALCLDTAHMTLNGEDLVASLELAAPYASTVHFCNCVTDPAEPLYGDHHPPLGAPGVLDVTAMGALMAAATRIGLFTPGRRCEVMLEQFNHDVDDVEAGRSVMRTGREALEEAWALSQR